MRHTNDHHRCMCDNGTPGMGISNLLQRDRRATVLGSVKDEAHWCYIHVQS